MNLCTFVKVGFSETPVYIMSRLQSQAGAGTLFVITSPLPLVIASPDKVGARQSQMPPTEIASALACLAMTNEGLPRKDNEGDWCLYRQAVSSHLR
jgi:hypothetical protein